MGKPNLMTIIDSKVDSEYVHNAIHTALNAQEILGDVYSRGEIDSMMNLKSNSDHLHTNHYSVEQADELLSKKADFLHEHGDIYVNKEDLASLDKSDLGGILVGEEENGIQMILRGGTTQEHSTFIGAAKEITIDTNTWSIRVHDGVTPGGHILSNKYTYQPLGKYINNELNYLNYLSNSNAKSYTKNEMNDILKALVSDFAKILGGEYNG